MEATFFNQWHKVKGNCDFDIITICASEHHDTIENDITHIITIGILGVGVVLSHTVPMINN